jgi:hypothetical protein
VSRSLRCLACALLALVAGVVPQALPASSAPADQHTKDLAAHFLGANDKTGPQSAASFQKHRAEEKEELEAAVEELEQALEQAEKMKHHHRHHHKSNAFDNGVAQLADDLAELEENNSSAPGSSNGQPGTSSPGGSQQGSPPASNPKNSSPTKGKGSFAQGGQHFGEWWHKKHHHHHHDHPFYDHKLDLALAKKLSALAQQLAANQGNKSSKTSKTTNGQNSQQTAGNTPKTFHPPTDNNNGSSKNSSTASTTKTNTKPGGKGTTTHPTSDVHFTALHHVGGSVGHRPTAPHHPAVDRRKK